MYFLDSNIKRNDQNFIDLTKTWSITKFTKTQRSEASNALFPENQHNGLNQEKPSAEASALLDSIESHQRKSCVLSGFSDG